MDGKELNVSGPHNPYYGDLRRTEFSGTGHMDRVYNTPKKESEMWLGIAKYLKEEPKDKSKKENKGGKSKRRRQNKSKRRRGSRRQRKA